MIRWVLLILTSVWPATAQTGFCLFLIVREIVTTDLLFTTLLTISWADSLGDRVFFREFYSWWWARFRTWWSFLYCRFFFYWFPKFPNSYVSVIWITTLHNKMKNIEYYTVGTFPKSNKKIVERGKIDTSDTQIHDHSRAVFTLNHLPEAQDK